MLRQIATISDSSVRHDGAPARAVRRETGARLRILLVIECSGAGTGRHVLDLSECLIQRGCEVHVLYSRGRIDRMFEERLARIESLHQKVVPMTTAPHLSDWAALKAIKRYMRAHGPFDVIHGHSSKGGALARLAAFGTGVPVFYTPHGFIMLDPQLSRLKWLFYLMVEFGMSLWTRRIIAVSPEEARSGVQLGLGRRRILTIPNGVGPARLTPRDEVRAQLGLAEDAVVIGFVGRLVEQKAPEILVEAFAAIVKSVPNARLVMVGSGSMDHALPKLATELGVRDKVLMLGERDARTVLAAFDIFALPSRKEGLPYVVLEAMAAGLPVVTSTTAGTEILVVPGMNGAVVPTEDVSALSRALLELATDPGRRKQYGRASLQRVKLFTIDLMADRTLEAYVSSVQQEAPR
jgi:glycosyltransferase involved in cell wall biosynthesis